MIFHDVEQGSPEWEGQRYGKATCSKYSCFMANEGKAFGDPAKRYALELALELLTGKKAEFSFSNEHMERGHIQEPIARMLYEEQTFSKVLPGGFFDCGTYGGSPDGLVGEEGLIEIKSVIAPSHYATLQRDNFDPAYRWQLVGELECTGREWVDYVSFCADFPEASQLAIYRITREQCEDEIRRLKERRAEFLRLVRLTISVIDPERCWPIAA